MNQPRPPIVPPPPPDGVQRAKRVEAVPGTAFGVVHLEVPAATSGLAIGALIAGVAAILVGLVVVCFGLVGAGQGWGGWAAGAFTVLGVIAGGAAVALGVLARRLIGRGGADGAMRFEGRGLALSGLICGAAGLLVTLLGFFAAVALQLTV